MRNTASTEKNVPLPVCEVSSPPKLRARPTDRSSGRATAHTANSNSPSAASTAISRTASRRVPAVAVQAASVRNAK
jgi:hypothetical protein